MPVFSRSSRRPPCGAGPSSPLQASTVGRSGDRRRAPGAGGQGSARSGGGFRGLPVASESCHLRDRCWRGSPAGRPASPPRSSPPGRGSPSHEVLRATAYAGPFPRPARQLGRTNTLQAEVAARTEDWVAARRRGVPAQDLADRDGVSHQWVTKCTSHRGPFPSAGGGGRVGARPPGRSVTGGHRRPLRSPGRHGAARDPPARPVQGHRPPPSRRGRRDEGTRRNGPGSATRCCCSGGGRAGCPLPTSSSTAAGCCGSRRPPPAGWRSPICRCAPTAGHGASASGSTVLLLIAPEVHEPAK